MSKIALIVGVIVLLILGSVVWWRANQIRNQPTDASISQDQTESLSTAISSPTVTTSNESPAETVIVYTVSGFSPSSLTVKQGTAITFKNSSSSPFRPASDPHPIHTAYREFDAKQTIAAGQSYTFTFDKVGSWGYHDHLNPIRVGTIVVE